MNIDAIRQLQIETLDLEARFEGKSMELAVAQGEHRRARSHMERMYECIQIRNAMLANDTQQDEAPTYPAAQLAA